MGRHTHRYFVRGRRTDGDSSDIEGDSLSEWLNFEGPLGSGALPLRKGLVLYDLGQVPYLVGYGPRWLVRWDSGISTVQHNSMIALRTESAPYMWAILSNAPDGGDLGASTQWTILEQDILTDYCDALASGGAVRVALGHNDPLAGYNLSYRIHKCLYDEYDGTRTYPGGLNVTSATQTVAGNTIGLGGQIYNGWLWDAGKLYLGTSPNNILDSFSYQWALAASGTGLPTARYKFAIVVVYDSIEPQHGLCKHHYMDATYAAALAGGPVEVQFFYTPTIDTFNKRISRIDVYAYGFDFADSTPADIDYRLISSTVFDGTMPTGATPFLTINDTNFWNTQGLWSANSGDGRPMIVGGTETTDAIFGSAIQTTVTHSDADVDASISVCPRGFMQRRKRLYAHGLSNDTGQTKIAVSAKDNIQGGQLDVFWKLNRIWHEHSSEVLRLEEYMDRMYLICADNSFLIDLEQRIDDQSQALDTGYGIGTTLLRTIAKLEDGVIFANTETVYRMIGGRHEDLMLDRWREEWQNIPLSYKQDAVAGANEKANEYWLCVQTGARQYSVYIYDSKESSREWRRYMFMVLDITGSANPLLTPSEQWITYFRPMGFFTDHQERFVLYGNQDANQDGVFEGDAVYFYRYGENDDGTPADDDGRTIFAEMRGQWIGVRADEHVIEKVDLQRTKIKPADTNPAQSIDENHLALLGLAINRDPLPVKWTAFPYARRKKAKPGPVRCDEYQFVVRTHWFDDGTLKPKIYEITVETTDDEKSAR